MQGQSTLSPYGKPHSAPPRSFRDLVAVLYRQAGLIVLCALAGSVAALALDMRRPGEHPAIAEPAQRDRHAGRTLSERIEAKLARARVDLRQCEDRIVALLVKDGKIGDAGATAEGGLRLDLDLEAVGAQPMAGAPQARTRELPLRLDEARPLDADDAGNARPGGTVRENTPLAAELNRLERARQLAQQRFVELRRKLDRLDPHPRPNPAAADGESNAIVLLGAGTGLLLGLLLAGLVELGGERIRSPRDAEWALGAPVLGAIPTLSVKARNACFEAPPGALDAAWPRPA
jgi:hypothetical protein